MSSMTRTIPVAVHSAIQVAVSRPSFILDVLGDIRPGDAGGPTQPGQDLVRGLEPVGRGEQALGGEGDRLDDAITVQRTRGMCTHSVHPDRPLLSPTVDEPR